MKLPEKVLSRLQRTPEEIEKERRPKVKMGGASTTPSGVAQFKERAGTLLGDIKAAAIVGAGERLMNADDVFTGVSNVRQHAVEGKISSFEDIPKAFHEGRQWAEDAEAVARARLPWQSELSVDLASNTVGKFANAPKALSKAMDKGHSFTQGGGIRQLAKSVGHEMKKGGVDEGIRALMDGSGMSETAARALLGSAGGGAGQLVLGEGLPRLFKYGMLGLKPAARVGADFYNQGTYRDGITPKQIREQYKAIENDNLNIFDVKPDGAEAESAANRLSTLVAKTNFLGRKDEPFNMGAFDQYAETMSSVQRFLSNANEKRLSHIADAIGVAQSPYYRYVNGATDELNTAKLTYGSLSQTAPGTLGHTPIRYKDATDRLEKELVALTNSDGITGLPDAYADAWNLAVRTMRPRVQHAHAKTTQTATSGDPNRKVAQDTDVDLDAVDTNVSRLLAARQELMRSVDAGAVIRGETEKALDAKVARDVAKLVDAQIEERLGSNSYSSARTEYAKYMKTSDANKMGNHFYHSSFDPEYKKSMSEYRDSLEGLERDAFDAGWVDSFVTAMKEDGIDATIKNKIGNVDFRANSFDVKEIKTEGWEQLKSVLGAKEAEAFIKAARDNSAKATAIKETSAYLTRKGYDPSAIDAAVRDGDELLIAAGFGPGQNAVLANATIASMQRAVAQYGPQEAAFMTKLMGAEGPELTRMLKKMEFADYLPDSVRGGNPMLLTNATGNQFTEQEGPKGEGTREELVKNTKSFLNSITPRSGQ